MRQEWFLSLSGFLLFRYPIRRVPDVKIGVAGIHAVSEAFDNFLCVLRVLGRDIKSMDDGSPTPSPGIHTSFLKVRDGFPQVDWIFCLLLGGIVWQFGEGRVGGMDRTSKMQCQRTMTGACLENLYSRTAFGFA